MKRSPNDKYFDLLNKEVTVTVNRPLGSKHPELDFCYPINYGFIPGTMGGEGDEMDAYVIGPTGPIDTFNGIVKALIISIEGDENKLVVCPSDYKINEKEILDFIIQKLFFKSRIILYRLVINDSIILRPLYKDDPKVINKAFKVQGWNKPVEQYEAYLELQESGSRDIIIAEYEGEFAGYLTIQWQSGHPTFADKSIPEVVDFNVLRKFQRQGLGTILMDEAERRIKMVSHSAGIGVGVTEDYGAAQILYAKRGYIPDGTGLTANNKSLMYGDSIVINDGVVFHLIKKLN